MAGCADGLGGAIADADLKCGAVDAFGASLRELASSACLSVVEVEPGSIAAIGSHADVAYSNSV